MSYLNRTEYRNIKKSSAAFFEFLSFLLSRMVFLSIPCKKGSEANLCKPIESYIKGNLGSSQAVACKKGLDHLQRLRNDILLKLDDSHESTIKLIVRYD